VLGSDRSTTRREHADRARVRVGVGGSQSAGGVRDTLVLPGAPAEAMSVFLAEVSQRHRDEWIIMALDGASWHRAKRLIVPAHMRLIPWPPGSPPWNLVEHLWDERREKWFRNRVFASLPAVEDCFVAALQTLAEDPRRVASLSGFDGIVSIPLNAN
jgi:DDE superfamily endonuclease